MCSTWLPLDWSEIDQNRCQIISRKRFHRSYNTSVMRVSYFQNSIKAVKSVLFMLTVPKLIHKIKFPNTYINSMLIFKYKGELYEGKPQFFSIFF